MAADEGSGAGQDEESSGPVVARNHTVDAVVAAIVFVFGAVTVVEARRLGAEWTSDGPGAGYFPFYIGLIICISSAAIFGQAMFGKSRDSGVFVDRVQLVRVLSVLGPAAVYVLAIWLTGFYVASALYIALFMVFMGKYPVVRSVVVAVAVNTVFFLMFEVWFKVPLYKGVLNPLGFLGY